MSDEFAVDLRFTIWNFQTSSKSCVLWTKSSWNCMLLVVPTTSTFQLGWGFLTSEMSILCNDLTYKLASSTHMILVLLQKCLCISYCNKQHDQTFIPLGSSFIYTSSKNNHFYSSAPLGWRVLSLPGQATASGGVRNIVNVITLHRLPVSCCNFTWMFST